MSTKYPSEDYHGVNTVTFNVMWFSKVILHWRPARVWERVWLLGSWVLLRERIKARLFACLQDQLTLPNKALSFITEDKKKQKKNMEENK